MNHIMNKKLGAGKPLPVFKKSDAGKLYAFDVETTSLYPYRGAKLFSYCITDEEGNTDVYRIDTDDVELNRYRRNILQEFFDDTSLVKIAHNYKFELTCLIENGFTVPAGTVWHDTMLMSQCLRNNAPSHKLEDLAWELFRWEKKLDAQVHSLGGVLGGFQNVEKSLMDAYQVADGQRTMLLFKTFYPSLTADEALVKDYNVELQMVQVTRRMEKTGIYIDRTFTSGLRKRLHDDYVDAQLETIELLDRPFNLNSDDDTGYLLFEKLGYRAVKQTEAGNDSVDKLSLDTIQRQKKTVHPIFNLIKKYRAASHDESMISSYLEWADDKGLIHPNIKTNQARTGRQSSSEPNLQNVRKEQKTENAYSVPARRCFVPHPGHFHLLVDYSGIEMRLIVDDAGDDIMINIINSNGDVHHEGMRCFSVFKGATYADDLKTGNPVQYKEERGRHKGAHFALPYGANIKKLAATLGYTVAELAPGLKLYKDLHTTVADYAHVKARQAKRNGGYIVTKFGRKLYLNKDKLFAAANYTIQGSAAGILKRAQIGIDKLYRLHFKDRVKLVLPIHDELIISVPCSMEKAIDEIVETTSKVMTYMPEFDVKLDVEWKIARENWADAKPLGVE